ncbi:MAG: hypothetical protein GIS02_04670 [Methanosarcinales archaeon]|uniref:Uncharacterized protein n=1 Tax=Candidatus Ethanoperedens thermophilum TaxID=2766897 RepID=A0A848DAF1_9EURY|nr:hypothetical protein [Candidatus Ethanoperedens thermophilum]
MNLTPQETERLEYLLGKSKFNIPTKKEESELRYLITKEQPSAENSSIDELIKLGLVLVGLYFLAKTISEK